MDLSFFYFSLFRNLWISVSFKPSLISFVSFNKILIEFPFLCFYLSSPFYFVLWLVSSPAAKLMILFAMFNGSARYFSLSNSFSPWWGFIFSHLISFLDAHIQIRWIFFQMSLFLFIECNSSLKWLVQVQMFNLNV